MSVTKFLFGENVATYFDKKKNLVTAYNVELKALDAIAVPILDEEINNMSQPTKNILSRQDPNGILIQAVEEARRNFNFILCEAEADIIYNTFDVSKNELINQYLPKNDGLVTRFIRFLEKTN